MLCKGRNNHWAWAILQLFSFYFENYLLQAMQGQVEDGREILKVAKIKWSDNADVLGVVNETLLK